MRFYRYLEPLEALEKGCILEMQNGILIEVTDPIEQMGVVIMNAQTSDFNKCVDHILDFVKKKPEYEPLMGELLDFVRAYFSYLED